MSSKATEKMVSAVVNVMNAAAEEAMEEKLQGVVAAMRVSG